MCILLFEPSIEGSRNYRLLISMDDIDLCSKYRRPILIVVEVDANNQLFSLLLHYKRRGQEYFNMVHDLPSKEGGRPIWPVCYIGLTHKYTRSHKWWTYRLGLGLAHHPFCVRHLANTFNNRFRARSLKVLLVRVACKCQPHKFHRHMEMMTNITSDTNEWLYVISPENWCLSSMVGDHTGSWLLVFLEFSTAFSKGHETCHHDLCTNDILLCEWLFNVYEKSCYITPSERWFSSNTNIYAINHKVRANHHSVQVFNLNIVS